VLNRLEIMDFLQSQLLLAFLWLGVVSIEKVHIIIRSIQLPRIRSFV
jgi:hypothetical protein